MHNSLKLLAFLSTIPGNSMMAEQVGVLSEGAYHGIQYCTVLHGTLLRYDGLDKCTIFREAIISTAQWTDAQVLRFVTTMSEVVDSTFTITGNTITHLEFTLLDTLMASTIHFENLTNLELVHFPKYSPEKFEATELSTKNTPKLTEDSYRNMRQICDGCEYEGHRDVYKSEDEVILETTTIAKIPTMKIVESTTTIEEITTTSSSSNDSLVTESIENEGYVDPFASEASRFPTILAFSLITHYLFLF
ncbi:unnamed protein product [Caenorhabditis bovis]|uniref:Uncharacterized protein n=1 Tax=Caenorhabditis bovis TaxID=2654633 RepID=A0A8S1EQP5_9PELO|nr:unnamed protein product [Caenorhabditis bovis]